MRNSNKWRNSRKQREINPGDVVRIKTSHDPNNFWEVLQVLSPFMVLIRNIADQEMAQVRGQNVQATPIDISLLVKVRNK